jgi:hypothetical protein
MNSPNENLAGGNGPRPDDVKAALILVVPICGCLNDVVLLLFCFVVDDCDGLADDGLADDGLADDGLAGLDDAGLAVFTVDFGLVDFRCVTAEEPACFCCLEDM